MKQVAIILSSLAILTGCGSANENKPGNDTTNAVSQHDGHDTSGNSMNNNTGGTDAAMNDMDREFVMKVGMGNTAEVAAGEMAKTKGADAGVKDFGRQMVQDHSEAQRNLKAAAGSMNVPDSVDAEHKRQAEMMKNMAGSKFDAAYINSQVADHKMTIELFERQASNGQNSALKNFATQTLPHLKMHLAMADSLQAKMKK